MSQRLGSGVLEHARVVHHDQVAARPLEFTDGRIGSPGTTRVDLRGHCIYPGLINAHDHLHLNTVPRVPHGHAFANSYEWIASVEVHRATPAVRSALEVPTRTRHWHGALKNLLAGVTTVAHHDPPDEVFEAPGFPVVVVRTGWSHSLGLGGGAAPRYGPAVAQSFAATAADVPWVIHLAEGTDDVARGELDALAALGCLAGNTVLVHGVALGGAGTTRVLEHGAAVVWCPASNIELFGATLDPQPLFDAGRLTLGTDSRLTGSCDLLDEMRAAASHSRLQARDLFRLVTRDAREIFRLPDRGRLEQGDRADLLILRDDGDPYRSLLAARRADIRAVVRNGLPVLADPDFAGWFADAGVATTDIVVDGCPRLMAADVADAAALALEPGITAKGT